MTPALSTYWRTTIAIVVFGIALTISVMTTDVALVVPFAFIVTCFAAWDIGLFASLVWVALVHVVLPCVLTLAGRGPFFVFHEAPHVVAIILAASALAEVVLAFLTVRCRVMTREYLQSRSALLEANGQLQRALDEVRELRGYLRICAWCKNICDADGRWEQLESYLSRNSRATLTHGLCPKCLEEQGKKTANL